jgi:hypothetical protein
MNVAPPWGIVSAAGGDLVFVIGALENHEKPMDETGNLRLETIGRRKAPWPVPI